MNNHKVSIIIPAKNESRGLTKILPVIVEQYPHAEIIVVDDGSTDNTAEVARTHGAKTVIHLHSRGNGAAIKSGVRNATGDILIFMDADGQHQPKEIQLLLAKLEEGYDMVVGARTRSGQASSARATANTLYNHLASWVVDQEVRDLTSGFRAARAAPFREFLFLLPNGFSYPTTCTMAFFRAGYSVAYVDCEVLERIGKSHIQPIQDGTRFLLIIFKMGTLFSPLKIFFPISIATFLLGLSYYMYTYITDGRFTNMGMLLFVTSLLIFLMGFISEQVTALLYKDSGKHDN